MVYKNKGKDVVELLSVIGEESYKSKNTYFDYDNVFTGMMLFESLEGEFLRGFYYSNGKQIGNVIENPANVKNGRKNACYVFPTLVLVYYYVTAGGITYPAQPNGDSRPSFQVVCDDMPQYITPSTYNSGAMAGGGYVFSQSLWAGNPQMLEYIFKQLFSFKKPSSEPPADVTPSEHLKCFDDSPGSTYRIFLNIDQPVDGSSAPLNPFATHKVGHAYLTFEQNNNGNVTSRSIGFYPETGGNPFTPSGPPQFNNDSMYSGGWDVQVAFNVTGSQMMSVVNYVSGYGSSNYHLMNRNCGNMCVGALGQIGIVIPTGWMNSYWYSSSAGYSTTTNVYGPSIGAFGEQIKNGFHTSVCPFSIHSNGGSAPSKTGSCN